MAILPLALCLFTGLASAAPSVALKEHTLPLQRTYTGFRPRPWQTHKNLVAPSSPYKPRSLVSFSADDPYPIAPTQGHAVLWDRQVEYLSAIQAGKNNLSVIIDTGSSDTWFVKNGFKCLDQARKPVPVEACKFGPYFDGDFPGGVFADQHFNVSYGYTGGPFLNGQMGYSDLTVAGASIPKQQIGLATLGFWQGDATSSGLLGLGLPGLTGAYKGPEATSADSMANMVDYNPLVVTWAEAQKAAPATPPLPPVFSLALSRDSSKSFLAFGGIPAGVKTTGEWATTNITKVLMNSGKQEYLFYQLKPDTMSWGSSRNTGNGTAMAPPEMIVDSGTTLNLFPYELAARINILFEPRPLYDEYGGAFFVDCNAKVIPSVSLKIGGKTLTTNPASMILKDVNVTQGATTYCLTGVGVTDGWPYILGDTFMQELVSVFDVGKMEMRFAHRV